MNSPIPMELPMHSSSSLKTSRSSNRTMKNTLMAMTIHTWKTSEYWKLPGKVLMEILPLR